MTTEECQMRLLELEASRHMYGDGGYIYDAVRLWTLQRWADANGYDLHCIHGASTSRDRWEVWHRCTVSKKYRSRAAALEAAWTAAQAKEKTDDD